MQNPEPAGSITCPVCGTVNSSHFRFCRNCGRLLPRVVRPHIPRTSPSEPPPDIRFEIQARRSGRFGIGILVGVALLALILGLAAGYFLAVFSGL
ncbi:MAG: hypothetical protein HYX86_04075 [Chloroflexi bacterium]|nr:hypothetical protein [Chloroflexota bacterium]